MGHVSWLYSADVTAVMIQPAVALRLPPTPCTGDWRADCIAFTTAARASGAIGHLDAFALHQAAKLSNACSNPFTWVAPASSEFCVGSAAPSRTMARMWSGNSSAYTPPSSVPYEKPR